MPPLLGEVAERKRGRRGAPLESASLTAPLKRSLCHPRKFQFVACYVMSISNTGRACKEFGAIHASYVRGSLKSGIFQPVQHLCFRCNIPPSMDNRPVKQRRLHVRWGKIQYLFQFKPNILYGLHRSQENSNVISVNIPKTRNVLNFL